LHCIALPKTAAKFSLADIKAKMVKKEKSEETPVPEPVRVPATRSKASGKKRKTSDSVINLEGFEGLSAAETKEKMQSITNLVSCINIFNILGTLLTISPVQGYDHFCELLRIKEEAYHDLQLISEKKADYYKQKEEAYDKVCQELEDHKVRAEEEKKLLIEEAKNSATLTVVESMYEMAKDAKAAGFSLPHWDLQGWAEMLGKEAELTEADPQATGTAGNAGEGGDAGKDGAGGVLPTGNDSDIAQT
jgi:hypothetical protein